MKKSFTEIYEGWSERDVNLMLFYLHCQGLANEPDDRTFYRSLADLLRRES
jgi:hypothetical protein